MSSIITAVFEVTVGLLVSKGRDKAAERLQRGDVTDQKFRGFIVREIEDVKSKLDGLARKDLFASISFFEEGIELLCDVFENTRLTINWPSVDIGEERVNPLRNERVSKILKKHSMEHCCVPWSFGQEGEVEHKLSNACGIATNTKGYFLIADNGDKSVKVFNRNGKFQLRFTPQTDDVQTKLQVYDVANEDVDDNIYLLVGLKKPGAEEWESEVQIFNTNGDLQHKF
ncbi:unnamed protein product, partial [Porites evermanni]